MTTSRRQRKLSNVKLTKRFHFQYMGLWVLATIALVVATNLVLYLAIELHLMDLRDQSLAAYARYMSLRGPLITGLIVETLLFSAGIAMLAMFTAHRAAGPYLRLQRAFKAVRDGDRSHRLRFRDYDQLDFLADDFNSMMDTLNKPTEAPEESS